MKQASYILALAVSTTMVATAEARQDLQIKDLPNSGYVVIEGEVASIENNQEFMLRDRSGSIEVETDSPVNVRIGEKLVVRGAIDSGPFANEIEATEITSLTHEYIILGGNFVQQTIHEESANEYMPPKTFINKKGQRIFRDNASAAELRSQTWKEQEQVENSDRRYEDNSINTHSRTTTTTTTVVPDANVRSTIIVPNTRAHTHTHID